MGETTVEHAAPGNSADDEDDNFEYPTAWRLAAITTALCLSVFCMALVRTIMMVTQVVSRSKLIDTSGQHNHRDRHSPHHRSIQSPK